MSLRLLLALCILGCALVAVGLFRRNDRDGATQGVVQDSVLRAWSTPTARYWCDASEVALRIAEGTLKKGMTRNEAFSLIGEPHRADRYPRGAFDPTIYEVWWYGRMYPHMIAYVDFDKGDRVIRCGTYGAVRIDPEEEKQEVFVRLARQTHEQELYPKDRMPVAALPDVPIIDMAAVILGDEKK